MSLKPREQRTLDAIRKLSKNGSLPTIKLVKDVLGTRSNDYVQKSLAGLRDKGLVVRWPSHHQPVIMLTPEAQKTAA
jgi:hypothetical protein